MNFALFTATRIYGGGENRKVSKPAVRIATAGVEIGLAVMIISVAVVLGFKHSIRNKVVGFGSHITVANFVTLQSSEQYPIQLSDSMMKALAHTPGVRHVQRFAYAQGVLKTNNDFLGVTLKGVDRDFDSTFIHECMAQGQIPKFGTEASTQQLLISKHIADKLKLTTGNRIFAYFLDGQHLRIRRFTIAGVYATNMKQFDEQMCFADITTVNKINGWKPDQYTGAEIIVESTHALDMTAKNVLKKVKNRTDKYGETYSSATIFEQYPQIFSWLGLMDLNVWIILALMLAVAGVTMISGLLIIILERTQTIGLLKALGARNAQVRHIFLWFSVFIIGKGLVIGNLLGLGICLLQKYTGLVKLDPQTYYVSTVPVDVDWLIVVILNISTLLICIFVLIGPSYLVSRIHPARSMHYE